MARVKTITLGVKRTFNLGNFQSLTLSALAEVEVEDNNTTEAHEKAQAEIMRGLEDLWAEHHEPGQNDKRRSE